MIYEYAIEPELVVHWGKNRSDYRYFYEQFGIGTPRMMAEFPKLKKIRKQFRQAAAGVDETNELPRITALFNLLKERLVRREGYEYDGTLSWLKNTEYESGRHPFQAILAMNNPRCRADVLLPAKIETSQLWQVKKQDFCPRKAQAMAQFLSALLSNCSEIHFIDPHFGPEVERWRKPLEAFLALIATKRTCRPTIKRITVHTSGRAELNHFKSKCKSQLQKRIPANLIVTFQRWNERVGGEKLHERYVLSDLGGIKVGPGLDDGNEGETFEAMLLERNFYGKQWSDYIENPAFDPAEDSFEITGIKRF